MRFNFLFIILVVPLLIKTQVINKAHHGSIERSFGMISVNLKSFYLEEAGPFVLKLVCLDHNNQTLFRNTLGILYHLEKTSITVTSNKQLVITGGTLLSSCDYGKRIFYVYRVDTNGTVLSTSSFTGDVKAWCVQGSGQFKIYLADTLRHFSSTGVLSNKNTLSIGSINTPIEMLALRSGGILISHNTGTAKKLRKAQSNGAPASEVNTTFQSSHLREGTDSSFYVLENGYIIKYLNTLNQLHSSATVNQSLTVSAFSIYNDTVFATGLTPTKELCYLMLDSALNLLHYAKSNIELSTPTGISVTGAKTNIITYGTSVTGHKQTFTGWFQTTKTGTLASYQDAGITNVVLDYVYDYSAGSNWIACVNNATVTLKNFSQDTLKSVNINNYAEVFTPCYQFFGLLKPISLSLPPNGTISVSTGKFYANLIGSQANVCLFTTIPNGMNDENVLNDAACTATTVVGIAQYDRVKEIKIFPNPASSYINIESLVQIKSVLVINAVGQIIREIELNGDNGISTIDFPPGFYLISCRSDQGVFVSRVIIEK